ncbi:MAG: protein kinase, partial [Lachnospiraceae bacterium]|nr:protein kinase [Lachnospiraceae bacterium]
MRLCMGCMKKLEDDVVKCPYCGYEKGTAVEEAYYLIPETNLHNNYLVGKVLGYGGFGITYIGWDLVLNRVVAIKEYFPSDYATRGYGATRVTIYSGDAREQFQHGLDNFIAEARKLASLNRIQGIVSIYDCFLENDTGYIVMEYLNGETVREMLLRRKRLPYEEAKVIVLHVLDGLEEVHREGLVHRDVAPDNIFLTTDGEVKLLDFGAARYAASERSRTLSVILKPGFAPEEQYRSHGNQGPWTDIYGLGATFYRMITGIRPEESIDRMVEDTLQLPSQLGVDIPEKEEAALMKSLAVRHEDRIQSAEEFKRLLTEGTGGKDGAGAASGSGDKGNKGKKLPVGVFAAAGVCIVAVLGVCASGALKRQKQSSVMNPTALLETETVSVTETPAEAESQMETSEMTEPVTESQRIEEAELTTAETIEAATETGVEEPQTEIITETLTEAEPETEMIAEVTTEAEPETERIAELLAEAEPDTEVIIETSAESNAESEAITESPIVIESEPEAIAEISIESEPETVNEALTEAPAESELITEASMEAASETEPVTEVQTEAASETEPVTEVQTEAAS